MTMKALLVLASATLALGQRPFFAGSKPIGFPLVTTSTTAEGLGDRFGEIDSTTQKLPLEANGDRDLVDRLSKLPIDKQPFWFINWQALEAHRQNPQTYPQKPNQLIDSFNGEFPAIIESSSPNSSSVIPSSGVANNPPANSNASFGNVSPILGSPFTNLTPTNVNVANDFNTSNRFGVQELPVVPGNNLGNASTNSNSQGNFSKAAGVLLSLGDKKKTSTTNNTQNTPVSFY